MEGFEPTHRINDERFSKPLQYHYDLHFRTQAQKIALTGQRRSGNCCTPSRSRTGTLLSEHQILSLGRLTIFAIGALYLVQMAGIEPAFDVISTTATSIEDISFHRYICKFG